MAAGTWKIYGPAKKAIGGNDASFDLGADVFKMCLMRTSASAALLALSTLATWASISALEITQQGGYLSGGQSLSNRSWGTGASSKQMKFDYLSTGIVWSGVMSAIKYAVIRTSTSAGGGFVLCFCTLSGTAFDVNAGNTLTILPAATGVFTLT